MGISQGKDVEQKSWGQVCSTSRILQLSEG